MSEMEKLLNEAEQYAADFEKFVAKAGPDYPKQRVIGLLREMSDALRQHATALEIGRGIGREEAAKEVDSWATTFGSQRIASAIRALK